MRRVFSLIGVVCAVLLALVLQMSGAAAQGPDEVPADGVQSDGTSAPAGFIDLLEMSEPYCYQPDRREDVCRAGFRHLEASTVDGSGMNYMTLTLSDYESPTLYHHRLVAHWEGLGQPSMQVTNEMIGDGLHVACGLAGEDDRADYGAVYQLSAAAFDNATNVRVLSMNVMCPPYMPGNPAAATLNSFTAALGGLSNPQVTLVALLVAAGLLVNLVLPARFRRWPSSLHSGEPPRDG